MRSKAYSRRLRVYLPTTTLLGGHVAWDLHKSSSMRPGEMDGESSGPEQTVDVHHLCSSSTSSFPEPKILPPVSHSQRCPGDDSVGQLLLKDPLVQAAQWQQKSCVSLALGQKLSQNHLRPLPLFPWSHVTSLLCPPVAPTVGTDMMKSSSCQPSYLSKRSGSSFNSLDHEYALIGSLGSATETSEHEHKGSAVAAAGPQPYGGVSQELWQRETKVHRVHLVSNGFSATTTRCPVRGISRIVMTKIDTTGATSRGLDGSTSKTFTPTVSQQWRAIILEYISSLTHTSTRGSVTEFEFFTSGPACEQPNRC